MLKISSKKLQTLDEIVKNNPHLARTTIWKELKRYEKEGLVIYQDKKTGGRPRRRWMKVK